MNNLKKLEVKRLIKELDFIESDFEYKNELINQIQSEFINDVNSYLDLNPELKKVFEDQINLRIEQTINKKISDSTRMVEHNENLDDDTSESVDDTDPKLRKLYREIVKKTHPDKIGDERMNDIYIKASKGYDKKDNIVIYSICDELGIDYDLDGVDLLLSEKIENTKSKINFLQSTFTWQWYYTHNMDEKRKIIIDYVNRQII